MFAQCPNHAAYVVRPLFSGRSDGLVEWEFVAFAVIGGIHAHGVRAVFGGSCVSGEIDGAGQDEAVVVVGVFADQVDAAGCADGKFRPAAELAFKDLREVHKVLSVGVCRDVVRFAGQAV